MFCFFDSSKKLVLTRGGGEIVREEIHSADDKHHPQDRRGGPRSQHGINTNENENFIYFTKNILSQNLAKSKGVTYFLV